MFSLSSIFSSLYLPFSKYHPFTLAGVFSLALIVLWAVVFVAQFLKPFFLHWRYKKSISKLYDEDF